MANSFEYRNVSVAEVATEVRALWKSAFGDSDEFIDTFFECFGAGRYAHILLQGRQLISMLFALPCSLHAAGVEYRAAYIYAVATDEAFRGRGCMAYLMHRVHTALCEQGCDAALLLPADARLWRYYGKLGYEACSMRTVSCVDAVLCDTPDACVEQCTELTDELVSFIRRCSASSAAFLSLSREILLMNLYSCKLSGGGLFICKDAGAVVSAAYVTIDEGVPLVLASFSVDDCRRNVLLNHLCKRYSVDSLCCMETVDGSGDPFAMMLRFNRLLPRAVSMQLMMDR